jgi:branched-chain amino acid transport system substrate-binding protein
VAVIGPFNSSVARKQIPVANAAGLLQCSPANTNPNVTKGSTGSALRVHVPPIVSYVRVSTTDDNQGPALARYAFETLGLRRAGIIDDTEAYGVGLADAFATEWERLGATVVGREGIPGTRTDDSAVLTAFAKDAADAVFFGGLTTTGGALVRAQMADAGLDKAAFLSGDGIMDGAASQDGTFLDLVGEAAANTYSSVAATLEFEGQEAFDARYRAAYGVGPGVYSGPAYACTQVILQAITTAAAAGAVTRETVRAAGVDTATTFDTVIGPVTFDAVGDIRQRTISVYGADPETGDWVYAAKVVLED